MFNSAFNHCSNSELPLLFILLLISLSSFPGAKSQPPNPNRNPNPNPNSSNSNGEDQYPYSNFNPSIAIIIVVLVAALFFMGFFSIYIRHCADDNSGGSVRNLLSMHARRANAAPRGIEDVVLETFPTFTYAEVKDHQVGKGALECAVCLNEFEDSETLRLIPRCDHVFHAECIDAWLQGHVTCPVCRADLTPKTEEESPHLPELLIPEIPESNSQTVRNDDVTLDIDTQERTPNEVNKPIVNRNLSFGQVNRPTRTESVKGGGGRRNFAGDFRSHSTGHSLVQPVENLDRFTLRLPYEMRKEMMNRALLNRTKSFAPCHGSTRVYADGSSRGGGGRSFLRIENSDRNARSDRWGIFSRASSLRSPKVMAEKSEGSTSKSIKSTVKKLNSFRCLEPKSADETGLVQPNSDRFPV